MQAVLSGSNGFLGLVSPLQVLINSLSGGKQSFLSQILFFFSTWDLFCSSCIYGKGADTRGVSKVHYLHGM